MINRSNVRERCKVKRIEQNREHLSLGVKTMNGLVLCFVPDLLLCFLHLRSVDCIDPEWFSTAVPYVLGQTLFPGGTQSSLFKPAP